MESLPQHEYKSDFTFEEWAKKSREITKKTPKASEDDKNTWMIPDRLKGLNERYALERKYFLEKYKDKIAPENPYPWRHPDQKGFDSGDQDNFFAGNWDMMPSEIVKSFLERFKGWETDAKGYAVRGDCKTAEDHMMYLYGRDHNWLEKKRKEWEAENQNK